MCALLAVPYYLIGRASLFSEAITGYVLAMILYWTIQAMTGFRRPTDELLVLGLISVLLVMLLPALAKARISSTMPEREDSEAMMQVLVLLEGLAATPAAPCTQRFG